MNDSMTLDLSGYPVGPILTQLEQVFGSYKPSDLFVNDTTAFLATQFDRALEQIESLQEGESKTVRGQEIRGWAQREVYRTQYGSSAKVGTRFYERKSRRGIHFDGPKSRKYYLNQEDTHRGTLGWRTKVRNRWEAQPVAEREYETVWRRRAGGSLYSQSSKLLQDNGAFRQALVDMNVTIMPGVVEFRPGGGVAYFDYQNNLRPIFVFYEADDGASIAAFMEADIAAVLVKNGLQVVMS